MFNFVFFEKFTSSIWGTQKAEDVITACLNFDRSINGNNGQSVELVSSRDDFTYCAVITPSEFKVNNYFNLSENEYKIIFDLNNKEVFHLKVYDHEILEALY